MSYPKVALRLVLLMLICIGCLNGKYNAGNVKVPKDGNNQSHASDAELGEQYFQKHFKSVNSDPAAAIADLKQSATYFIKATQILEAASSLAKIGQIYTSLGMHSLAFEYLLEVQSMLKGQPESSQIAWLYSDIGNVYYAMEQTDLAEPYYWQGLRMMERLGDTFGQSVMLNNIGLCQLKQNKPESALSYYKQAMKLREATKDRFAVCHSLNLLGDIYQNMGDYDLALQHYLKVFNDLSTPAEPKDASNALRATAALSLNKLYIQLNNPDVAEKYLEEAIAILTTEGDSFRLNDALKLKADHVLAQGNSKQAGTIYQQIYTVACKNSFWEQAKNASCQLGTIYTRQNDPSQALEYWSAYKAYSDSLFALRSPATLVRLHSSVQNNLKDMENSRLKQRQRSNTRFAVIIMVLLGIIVLLFIRVSIADKRNILRLRQLADASYEGVIVHDKGLVIEVNDRFLEILGLTRQDCIGHHITEVTNMEVDNNIQQHVEAGGIQNYEIVVTTTSKGLMNLEIMSRPYTYINNHVRVAAIRDITERKKFITTLLDTQTQLSELNSTKDKLFSIIAHDLKNPFSAIIGFSEVLRNNLDKFDATQTHDMIVQIHETSTAAYVLLQNLLEWAKLQIGAVSTFPQQSPLLPILTDVVSLIKAPLAAKEISLSINCPASVTIYADMHMLHSILNNLLSNAMKFTPNKGIITINARQNGSTTIDICDTGIGMDADLIAKLFKIESIKSRRGTNHETGTGIGLILCKDMIDLHKGSIEVLSIPDEGSQFRVSFPGRK